MKLFSEYRGLRRELYILFIGRIMTNLGSMIWPMFTLIMNLKLGFDASTIALCMLVYSIVSLPVNLLGGKLADRMNKKNIIVVCDLVSIFSYLYCAMVPVTVSSMAVFAAASLFQSIEWPAYDALVADFTTSSDRERAYSLSYLGSNLGLVLAPTIGGILLNEHLNLAFLINGLAIASSTVLIFFKIRDVHREEDHSARGTYEAAADAKMPTIPYILKNRVVLLFIIAMAFGELVYGMWGYLMPLDLSTIHGDRGSVIFGSANSLNCIIVVVFTSLITRIFRRIRDSGKLLAGESLILCGYLLFMLLKENIFFVYLAITVFTFGEIFSTLASSPFLTRRIPASHRGRIMSFKGVFVSLFGSVAQVLIGKVYDLKGSMLTWILIIAIGLIEISLVLLVRYYDHRDYPMLAGTMEKE